jgi:hypothetical protein
MDVRIQRLWELDPEWGHAPWRASPSRVERVLHVHLGTPAEPQKAMCNALASLATPGGYCRVDWTGLATMEQRHQAVIEAAVRLMPSIIFMQLQGPGVLTAATVAQLRRVSGVDDLVIASWCGDVGGCNGPMPASGDAWGYEMSRCCDLMLYSSMSQVRAHRSRGMHNAAYLQIGYDEDRYFEGPDEGYGERFDAVFLGGRYEERHWSHMPGNDTRLRADAAQLLQQRLGARFGLFGGNWPGEVVPVPPAQSGDVYRSAKFALNISVASNLERYSSDRLFRALACGTPVLLKRFSDWGSYGMVHEHNVLAWDSLAELATLVAGWVQRTDELRRIGRAGADLARDHNSWGIRMLELYPLITAARSRQPAVSRPW